MSKQKTPSPPQAPTSSPFVGQAASDLSMFGRQAANLDFGGSPLQQAIELDPEVTRLALEFAQNSLAPQWESTLKTLRNEAANAGALQSSTFTDALSSAGRDLQSQYAAITSQAALEDRNRALNNRVSLFGTGLNAIQGSGNLGVQENQFNLQNYENQLAAWQLSQKEQNGGFLGGSLGAIGGALAGLALAPVTGGSSLLLAGAGGLGGGLLGGFGSPGTGGSLLTSGAGLLGNLKTNKRLNEG